MSDAERHALWVGVFTPPDLGRVRGPALRGGVRPDPAGERVARVLDGAGTDPVNRLLHLDLDAWFPDNILAKVDKMSMASSLEAREPLLDHRLVETMGTLPSRLKVRGLRTKVLLKLVAQRALPEFVVRRPKHPFRVPIGPWLRGPLDPMARELLDPARLRQDGYFDPAHVSWMLSAHRESRRDFHRELWVLLCFQLWHAIFIRRSVSVGSD
jgi:asparagine synthase (glutamine-hydrolysing)